VIRFLRCFALFRRLEEDLAEARTTVGIERELRLRADAEAERWRAVYEEERAGHTSALKRLNNVTVQTTIGCAPPHPDEWHLPQRAHKPYVAEPIETGRVNPNDVIAKARHAFAADVEEFLKPKQNA
jgi:hypothetical protein